MISIYQLKPKFQELLQPLLSYLYTKEITANQITWGAIVWSILIGFSLLRTPDYPILWLLLPLGLLFRMILNALDGMMARQYQMQSVKGEILNELGDVISDTFIALPFFFLFPKQSIFIGIFLLLSIINEFAGVLAKAINGQRRYDGPMGKSDRAFLLALIGIAAFFWKAFLIYLPFVFLLASLLLLISTKARLTNLQKDYSV